MRVHALRRVGHEIREFDARDIYFGVRHAPVTETLETQGGSDRDGGEEQQQDRAAGPVGLTARGSFPRQRLAFSDGGHESVPNEV